MQIVEVKIADIIIRKRVRKDLGDLIPLAESIRRHGLMNPIVLNEDMELIAGHRRLESARSLGWRYIPAVIVRKEESRTRLELEIEENVQRADLSPEELADAYFRLERLKNPGFFTRLWFRIREFIRRLFNRKTPRKHRR